MLTAHYTSDPDRAAQQWKEIRHKQRHKAGCCRNCPPQVVENMVELVGIEPTTSSLRTTPMTYLCSFNNLQPNEPKNCRRFQDVFGTSRKTAHTGDSHGY